MAAPSTQMTTQQIKGMQEQSPSWNNVQLDGSRQHDNQQIAQQWRAIFNDLTLCSKYTSIFNSTAIQVPTDPNTRKIAVTIAREVINNRASNRTSVNAAQKFIKKCSAYDTSYNRQIKNQTKQTMKQNPGVGSYTADKFVPIDPNNKQAIKDAAIAAGSSVAYFDMQLERATTSDERKRIEEQRMAIEQKIQPQLNNKMYSTYFLYTYCTNTKFQRQEDEAKRQQQLNQIDKQYRIYEDSFRAAGDPNKKSINDYDRQKLNTYK